jgi:hypothetical protein
MTTPVGAPLSGLTGMYGDPQDLTDYMDEGVLEAKANALDPEHSQYGSQSTGFSGTVPDQLPYGDFDMYNAGASGSYPGWQETPGGGVPLDETPTTHSATYPRGIIQPDWGHPDAYADVGEQISAVHDQDLGGPAFYNQFMPAGREQAVDWTTDLYQAPDETIQATVPGQLKGSNGYGSGRGNSSGAGGSNADPVQGYGVVNTLPEFNTGHSMRYVQHNNLGFDYTNLHGEQQEPFWGKHPTQQATFDGPDSPYYVMGDIDGANIPWEGRIGYPTPYEQAPEPTIVAASDGSSPFTEY